MDLTTLINTLQNLELGEDSFIFKPNMTDFDPSKPIVLDEIILENPACGFGGVTEQSLEARFWLPNSMAFTVIS